ncbi:MAG: flagellin [Paracoccaceae bacterium]
MSSILTNTSAMVALQTMKGINAGMNKVQAEISTGKSVGSAKDNAAVWAISKVMESDVKGFKGISDSLSLGSSTISVARQAAETVTELLTEIKGKVVAAQGANVDRVKIQSDIKALTEQIGSVVGSAQFNGLNLVDNSRTETVLSSLDRSGTSVTASRIGVEAQDLSLRAQVFGSATARAGQATVTGPGALGAATNALAGADVTITGTATAGSTASMTFTVGSVSQQINVLVNTGDTAGDVATKFASAIGENKTLSELGVKATGNAGAVELRLTGESRVLGASVVGSGAAGGITVPAGPAAIAASFATGTIGTGSITDGDSFRFSYGGQDFDFVANERSNRADVLAGLTKSINDSGSFFARVSTNGQNIEIASVGTSAVVAGSATALSGGKSGGGLQSLSDLNVADFSTQRGGADGNTLYGDLSDSEKRDVVAATLGRALTDIESLIDGATSAAASLGSVQKRIDIQSDFVGKLSDALKSGIGTLVDADMEEASARLQALQVQQQLGIQSLSIANQQPQNLLSLFR